MTSIDQLRTDSDARCRWRQIRRTILVLLPMALAAAGCRDSDEPTAPKRVGRPNGVILTTPHGFTQVGLWWVHACAVRDDGVVECWGDNSFGQAPPMKTAMSGLFTQVSPGRDFTCALRDDGVVECWGFTNGGAAPAVKSALSGSFTHVSAGLSHACAVRADGVVECWGNNSSGQAPAIKTASAGVFTQVDAGQASTCAVRADGVVECWGENNGGNTPATKTASAGVFTKVSVGNLSTCALRDDGVVECWGQNIFGQAPATKTAITGVFTQVAAGASHTCAVRNDGVVECWGYNFRGAAPATRIPARGSFTQVTASTQDFEDGTTCAVRDDGVVECWGPNAFGAAPPIKTATSTTTHVLPTASLSATPASVVVGAPFTLALSGAQVPDHPDATAFTYAFDCGDGSGYGPFGTTSTATCGTAVPGTRTVKGSVRDQDNDASEYTTTVQITPPADATPPVITPTITGTIGANGWYTSDVTVTWSVSDAQSTVSSQTGCGQTRITTDTPSQTITCSATSAGGPNSQTVTIKRDATAPTLAPAVSPNPVMLNATASAAPNATDALSGVASATCAAPTASTVGTKSVSCTVTDNAGNQATRSASYTVTYQFGAFASPIDGNGVLNVAKAGQSIPLKWRLLDAAGLPITNRSAVTVTVANLSCALGASADAVEEYATGASGLQNLGDGYYQYNWSTPKTYAGSCKTMQLDLGEGLMHTALFQFTK